jgi:prolyl-tRNA editing enzyme YbaK/EbsC (Cys-tRNA(Pro) deacylase)
MAAAKQVCAVTGQAIGRVASRRTSAAGHTVFDAALADYETIWAATGTPHTVMPLTLAQLVPLTGGQQVQVASS